MHSHSTGQERCLLPDQCQNNYTYYHNTYVMLMMRIVKLRNEMKTALLHGDDEVMEVVSCPLGDE